jgi:hypothetical protein
MANSADLMLPQTLPKDAHTRLRGSVKTLLEPLELPMFSLVQNNKVMHVNPSALRFWSTIGLAPLRGAKDVNAFALFQPGDGCSPAALRSWLLRVTHSYEVRTSFDGTQLYLKYEYERVGALGPTSLAKGVLILLE